ERTSPSPHRRRLTEGGLLRRSYRLLGMIAVATLGTILVAAYLVPFPARAWYRDTLAPSADGVSMAQDESGYLHIVYSRHTSFDRVLTYMTNAGGKWSSRDLDPGSTCCASVAMDSRGRVHAAYTWWNSTYPPVVRYVTWDGQHANITPILSRTWVGSASIAVDSLGHLHLAYLSSETGLLRYATNLGGTWTKTDVGPSSGMFVTLRLDSSERPHIAFSDRPIGIAYATDASGVWTTSHIEEQPS